MNSNVYVELGESGVPIRIFRNQKAAVKSGVCWTLMARNQAVPQIRHQLFLRSEGFCELCGIRLTEQVGEMHEQKSRGLGGEISLTNSIFICHKCHRIEDGRDPRWSKHDSQSK